MLNLTESWKAAYAEYLKEDELALNNEIDNFLEEIITAQNETQKSFNMLQEYYSIYAQSEGVTLTEDEDGNNEAKAGTGGTVNNKGEVEKKDNTDNKKDEKEKMPISAINIFSGFIKDASILKDGEYKPVGTVEVEKMQDMKFPKNIIFFITQILKWIRNVVIYFIEKVLNIFRRLFHRPELDLNPSALKLSFEKSKKIDTLATPLNKRTVGPIQAYTIDNSSLEQLTESENLEEGILSGIASELGMVKNAAPQKDQRVVVTIDVSKDLMNLKESIDHFFKLFDNAYGGNNENLFDTEDLKLILEIFKDTMSNLKTGDAKVYSYEGGVAVSVSPINRDRVKETLVNTNININRLKEAYMQTANKIGSISRLINSKEMMLIANSGVDYKLLSSATYTQLKKIVDIMPAREKNAKKLESNMEKLKKKYEDLIKDLTKMQSLAPGLSNVQFNSTYERKVNDLLVSAKYMTDVVTLRLSGLAMYIKSFNDVRGMVKMLIGTTGKL